jgi:L,D-peptidoglycan transpeptidase YkuD (ErfK/YbiS/YcfS/YnhG family)
MIKSFLILLSISISLFSSEQIILVVSDELNSSQAKLTCFEDGKKVFPSIRVNLGKNGLALGLGEYPFKVKKDEPLKYEGDKKAPIGVFKLSSIFGHNSKHHYKMPYLFASEELICVDESKSNFYNQIIIAHGDEKSFEYMRRKDHQYTLGVVVEHNKEGKEQRGSCIFLHVEKYSGAPTAGCTSMSYENLKKIVMWLDKRKNPILIQVPKSRLAEVLELYPKLSKLNLQGQNKEHLVMHQE